LITIMNRLPWKWLLLAAILLAEVGVLVAVVIFGQGGPMFGIAAPAGSAAIEMANQHDVVHQVVVDRVVSPVDGWVIIQADWDDGIPDAILGSAWVPKGESRNVVISLDPQSPMPRRIFATLLADMGIAHTLEYSVPNRPGMENMRGMGSTIGTGAAAGQAATKDMPIIAGGNVVTAHVGVSALSFSVGPGQASISETTRTLDATSVVVMHVVAPAQSWVAVSVSPTSSQPSQQLGATLVQPGATSHVVIPLNTRPGPTPLVVTLHVDLGTLGQFDYSPLDRGNSLDQPYVVGGKPVSVPIAITPR
jgi:hypothetical protein